MTESLEAIYRNGTFCPVNADISLSDGARVRLTVEPIYEGQADAVPPGSTCVGVAYTSREAERESGEISGFSAFTSVIVDGMGIANALVIRIQALLLPIRALVFSG